MGVYVTTTSLIVFFRCDSTYSSVLKLALTCSATSDGERIFPDSDLIVFLGCQGGGKGVGWVAGATMCKFGV